MLAKYGIGMITPDESSMVRTTSKLDALFSNIVDIQAKFVKQDLPTSDHKAIVYDFKVVLDKTIMVERSQQDVEKKVKGNFSHENALSWARSGCMESPVERLGIERKFI